MIPDNDFITSLLNVKPSDIAFSNVRKDGDTVYYEVTLVRKPMSCPLCGGVMIGHGHKQKSICHPAFRDHKGIILYNTNRYICKSCRTTSFEKNPFAFEGFNTSFFLLQSAMKMLGNLNYNLKMISDELHISATQLCKYLDSYITIPPRSLPECLGIDEIHNRYLSRRNSSYLCVLVDNENRHIYDILDSRSKEHLSLYFSAIPRAERCKVKYVTIDMWKPYEDVVNTYFPNAIVAVDPFHVVWHLNNNFEHLRLDLMKQCDYGSNQYYLLKKWSWLLEKDNIDLDNERLYNSRFKMKLNRRDLLHMIFEAFPVLGQAYSLKEEYRKFNKECSFEEAPERLSKITGKFKNSGIRQYDEFTAILSTWREEILNYFMRPYGDRKLSNAFSENINGKIRTYLAVSNGVSNFERFRKRIIFALSPDVNYALTASLQSCQRTGKKRGPYRKPKD